MPRDYSPQIENLRKAKPRSNRWNNKFTRAQWDKLLAEHNASGAPDTQQLTLRAGIDDMRKTLNPPAFTKKQVEYATGAAIKNFLASDRGR